MEVTAVSVWVGTRSEAIDVGVDVSVAATREEIMSHSVSTNLLED